MPLRCFTGKLGNCPGAHPDTNPLLEHHLQLLLRYINTLAMAETTRSSRRSPLPENGLNKLVSSPTCSPPIQLKGIKKTVDFVKRAALLPEETTMVYIVLNQAGMRSIQIW